LKHAIQLEWAFKFESSKTKNPQLALEKRRSFALAVTRKKKANRLNLRARKNNQNPKILKNIHQCKVNEILWNQT
jgi:hypothetical protein